MRMERKKGAAEGHHLLHIISFVFMRHENELVRMAPSPRGLVDDHDDLACLLLSMNVIAIC